MIAANDAALLTDAAREAGAIALSYFRRDPKVWTKGQDSPVSEADIAVDKYLNETLIGARGEYGWLSEETADTPDRLSCERVFVVDPIDGTRAFIEGGSDWTVSLAVVEAGRPIAAALYAPVHDEMFVAGADAGVTLNGGQLTPSDRTDLNRARVAGPRNMVGHALMRKAGIKSAGFVPSLAYRLALTVTGRLDGAVARPKSHDWDLAAADLIVHEAGGRMTDSNGRAIRYNTENLRHPALVAAPAGVHEGLRALVARVLEK